MDDELSQGSTFVGGGLGSGIYGWLKYVWNLYNFLIFNEFLNISPDFPVCKNESHYWLNNQQNIDQNASSLAFIILDHMVSLNHLKLPWYSFDNKNSTESWERDFWIGLIKPDLFRPENAVSL